METRKFFSSEALNLVLFSLTKLGRTGRIRDIDTGPDMINGVKRQAIKKITISNSWDINQIVINGVGIMCGNFDIEITPHWQEGYLEIAIIKAETEIRFLPLDGIYEIRTFGKFKYGIE